MSKTADNRNEFSVVDLNKICTERCEAVLLQCINECPNNDTNCFSQCIREQTDCFNGKIPISVGIISIQSLELIFKILIQHAHARLTALKDASTVTMKFVSAR